MSQLNQFRFRDVIRSLSGDIGGAVGPEPITGNLDLIGGNLITTTGAPLTYEMTIDVDATVAASFVTDAGTATPALNSITIAGGTNINTAGAGSTVTINLDDTITLTQVNATTFDTNVAAAGVTLSGTTLQADGTDADININITAKGAGKVIIDDLKISGLTAGVLKSSATGEISTVTGVTNQVLQAVTGDVPVYSTATYPNTVVKGDILSASANNVVNIVTAGTTGQVLQAVTTDRPAYSTTTYPSTSTKGDILVASANNVYSNTAAGTDGQLLIGKSAGNVPIWASVTNGNNITATGGANSLSIAVTGTTQHALQVGTAAGALSSLAVGATGVILQGAVGADPAWSTVTYPSTTTAGDILYASADNVLSLLAKNATASRYLSNSGVGNIPAWAQVDLSNGVTSTLPVANGGTGATTLTIHGVLLGSGTSAITATAVGATGEIFVGVSGADAAWLAAGDASKVLTAHGAGSAVTWEAAGGGGALNTLESDSGTATPVAGNIIIAGGSNIATSAAGNILTVALDSSISVTGDIESTAGDIYAAGNMGCLGEFVAGTDITSLAGDLTVATLSTAGFLINDASGLVSTSTGTAGQVPIGSDAGPAIWSNITSTTLTITNSNNNINMESYGDYILGINEQVGTSYTLVLTDAGKEIRTTNSSAVTITIPTNAAVAFPTGTEIVLIQYGAGALTIVPDTGVTMYSTSGMDTLYERYSCAILIKQASDIFILAGDIK